jgi:hypothetical protein
MNKPEDNPAGGAPFERPVGRPEPERAFLGQDREWHDYPAGTKAHAYNGGAWLKLDNGRWQWNGHTKAPGSTFPAPGADAIGACVELPPATVNRYCRAGMCLKTDAEHEPWCELHEPPNVRVQPA